MTKVNSLYCFLILLGLSFSVVAQDDTRSLKQRQLETALRTIGHNMLLADGDSTSRILPIDSDGELFRLSFETELKFTPLVLVLNADSVLKSAGINGGYVIEVEECESKAIVYSFEMPANLKLDSIPCGVRLPPRGCYTVVFNFDPAVIDPFVIENAEGTRKEQEQEEERSLLWYILPAFFGVIAVFIYGKRKGGKDSPFHINLGKYTYDKKNMELLLKEQRIQLTAKESDLLLLLYQNVNETVERDVLLKEVWGDEGDYIGRTLDVYVSKLRKKLEADPSIKIMNIRGVGYKLIVNES